MLGPLVHTIPSRPTPTHSHSDVKLNFKLMSGTSDNTTYKGKGKGKAIMQGGMKKRPLSLEDQVEVLAKKISKHESILETCRYDMACLEEELEKKKRFDTFMEMMYEDQCVICQVDLAECVGTIFMAIASYECECTKTRTVHLGCWTREFRCACGHMATMGLKSASGKDVAVRVEEVADEADTETEAEM